MIKYVLLICIAFNSIYGAFSQNSNEIKINDDIYLQHLQDSVFIHTTYHTLEEFGRFPSNGMLIVKGGEAILIDTPWGNEKTQQLLEFLEEEMNIKVVKLIIGHYHNDCMGGIDYIHSKGIESIACAKTIEKCKEFNLSIPKITFKDSLKITLNGKDLLCKYFGGGHTIDNIVVWVPEDEILFGGCLIKSLRSNRLGNIADAVVDEWDETVLGILGKYKNVKVVVPGHGMHGDKALLVHTIDLVRNHKKKNNENPN